MTELYDMPGHLVRRVQQIATALFAEECGAFDLTSVQFAALTVIAANPGIDATRLSHLVAFDRSTLGDVLERLEAKGLVDRSTARADRRVKRLQLTPAGLDLLERVRPAVARVQARLLQPLRAADRSRLVHLLALLAHVHNDVSPAPLRVPVLEPDAQEAS